MCASLYTELSLRPANDKMGMSHPDGDPPRPRRAFDLDTLIDCAGVFLAIPLIVVITWLILYPTHLSLPLVKRNLDEVLTAAALDGSIFFISVGVILLIRRPPIGLIWKVLMLGIFLSLCAGSCWLTAEFLNYWWQPK